MPQLVLPHKRYKTSYLEALQEFQEEQLSHYQHQSLSQLKRDFSSLLRELQQQHWRMPDSSRVPRIEYWLVHEDEYLGRLVIRYFLTPQLREKGGHVTYDVRPSRRRQGHGTLLLQLGLHKAQEMGFSEVLLTCNETNIASRRVIEKNGGRLADIRRLSPEESRKLYYWITLTPDEKTIALPQLSAVTS